jgi:DNA-binding NarL/FixJ family response regulator
MPIRINSPCGTSRNGKKPVFKPHVLKIVLVDDHPVMLSGLEQIINAQKDMQVVSSLSRPEALLRSDNALGADLLVLDLLLGNRDPLALLGDITSRHPKLLVLVFSMCDERIYAPRVLRNGARGYLMKDHAPHQLIVALRRVWAGEIFLSRKMKARQMRANEPKQGIESLTDREVAVFGLIGDGLGTKEIAGNLGISHKTVESHRENIKRKLGISRIDKLVSDASRWRAFGGKGTLRIDSHAGSGTEVVCEIPIP